MRHRAGQNGGVADDVVERARELATMPTPSEARAIRVAAKLTQADLAEALGVDLKTVLRWETGRNWPRGDRLLAYARLLARLQAVVREAS